MNTEPVKVADGAGFVVLVEGGSGRPAFIRIGAGDSPTEASQYSRSEEGLVVGLAARHT